MVVHFDRCVHDRFVDAHLLAQTVQVGPLPGAYLEPSLFARRARSLMIWCLR